MTSATRLDCSSCGKFFKTKQNFSRHMNSIHSPYRESFKCTICDFIFYRKYDLTRHQKLKHSDNSTSFKCENCHKNFVSKQNLTRHQNTLHFNQKKKFMQVKFVENSTKRTKPSSEFIKNSASKSRFRRKNLGGKYVISNEDQLSFIPTNSFECSNCCRKFNRKFSLIRHLKVCQNRIIDQDVFECAVCGVEYKNKNILKQHIRRRHSDGYFLRCKICNVKIRGRCNEKSFARHMDEFHAGGSNAGHIKCALCENTFSRRESIWLHIIGDAHKVQIDHEHLKFPSVDEFKKWKAKIEKITTTFFRKKNTKYFVQHSVCRFICHRSGSYEPKGVDRKRRIKLQGSKKIGAFCPAEMILYERKVDGACRVSYVSTHLGHNVCDKSELAHVYLTKEERVKIASKLSSGVSYSKILTENVESTDASYLLNKRDLLNISRDFNVKGKEKLNKEVEESPSDPIDFDDFIKSHEKSILFCKKQGEEVTSCDIVLSSDDLFVVVMTDEQIFSLRKFGYKVILIDNSHDVNDSGFLLQTILVIDEYGEAVPVAFAVSNRNDEHTADLFLHHVKKKVGIVSTATLMCNNQFTYFGSWIKLMGPVKYRSFCRWQTNEIWRLSLSKISNIDKRKFVRDRLIEISTYLDVKMFHSSLDALLSDTDSDLEDFLSYFRSEFCENFENWAHCYRRNTDINMLVESFNRSLKYLYGKLSKVESLNGYLAVVGNCVEMNERDLKRKEIRGKVSLKLQELRRRHDECINNSEILTVDEIPDIGWYVSVSSKDSVVAALHLVQECDYVCTDCKLFCDKCGVCIHKYRCTCSDNIVKNNMCHHIHAMLSYSKSTEHGGTG